MNVFLVWTERAEIERDNIYLQINQSSPSAAAEWLVGLSNVIAALTEWPGPRACPRYEEACDLYGYEVRQIIYRGPSGKGRAYRILFRAVVPESVDSDFDVTILRVLYGAQLLTPPETHS